MVSGQHEGSGLETVAMKGDAGALELIAVVIPELRYSPFCLDPIRRLLSIDSCAMALALFPGNSQAEAEEKKKG